MKSVQQDTSSRHLRVAIAGGGIGGMALALSLHAAGFNEVDVYESAPSVKELGVGINVQPHATPIAAYDAERRPQTTGVVLANRQGGPEKCLDVVEQRAPHGFLDLDAVVSRQELEEIAQSYKRTAGLDSAFLNNRPSLSVERRSRRRGQAGRPAPAASPTR